MGDRCRDCRAVVRRAGLAMAAFARAGPGGDTGRRGSSILAAGGWSNRCLGHASAEVWTTLRRSPRVRRSDESERLTRVSLVAIRDVCALGLKLDARAPQGLPAVCEGTGTAFTAWCWNFVVPNPQEVSM